jgi:hypothetical protein
MLAFIPLNIDDNSIMLVEQAEGLTGIHESFSATEYGARLAGQIRFGLYKPEDVDNERWRKLLGSDVNNLSHMQLTHGLTRSYLSHLNEAQPAFLNPEEYRQLEVAALIHDWAESIVGDIPYSYKTDDDELEEKAHFINNLGNFYTDDDQEIVGLIHESVHNIIFDRDGKLGKVFNSIESIGYVRTALRAFEHIKGQSAPDCHDKFRQLVADVLGNQTMKLINYSFEYAPVDLFLRAESRRISEAFTVADDSFANFGPEMAPQKIDQFIEAEIVWCSWVKSISSEGIAS